MFTGWLLMRFYFNPRSPCGERLKMIEDAIKGSIISIHAPRAGSDVSLAVCSVLYFSISIHAPRAGSDRESVEFWMSIVISIHAPRAGSDAHPPCTFLTVTGFQSTLPVRGATTNSTHVNMR